MWDPQRKKERVLIRVALLIRYPFEYLHNVVPMLIAIKHHHYGCPNRYGSNFERVTILILEFRS